MKYMHIQSATFIKGVIGTEGLPHPLRPTIAFFGRSNVGKSSVVNRLTRTSIARANKKPGRTTEINYYLINENFYLADLPGYGYAKLPPKLRDKISGYLSWFAEDSTLNIKLCVLIVDAAVGPKEHDITMFHLLKEYERPLVILANKIDKENQSTLQKNLSLCKTVFPETLIIPFSAKTGRGIDTLLETVSSSLEK